MLKKSTLSLSKIFILLFLMNTALYASDYNHAQIDQRSNRAIVHQQQLWDGVYPQADGSTIWVRNGIATSNRNGLSLYDNSSTNRGYPSNNNNSCLKLVQKSCGLNNACPNSQACNFAVQMQQLKDEEDHFNHQEIARYGQVMGQECQKALNNSKAFPRCQKSNQHHNACQQLINKTCGTRQQCQNTRACDFSHQLFNMEQEERQNNSSPTLTEQDCKKGLQDLKTFPNCR